MDGLVNTLAETMSRFRFSTSGVAKALYSGLQLFSLAQGAVMTKEAFNASCSSIASELSISNATVFLSEVVLAGSTVQFGDNHASCERPSQVILEDTCRVALYVSTSGQSGINMEVWLPHKWTGRFMSTGNSGLGGCIKYEDLAYASALGFATVGANNGHNGTSGEAFLDNSDVVEDFAYRSVHTGVVVGKQISKSFYGAPHTKSYYLGCSTGGRQGLKSVQDFPEDFDGVAAGAPAISFNDLLAWNDHFFGITGPPDSPSFISRDKWLNLIHPDIMKQCDMLDGVVDGILEDPNLCDYKPEGLICSSKAKDQSNCLTGAQAKIVRKVFSPMYGPDGDLWYPRQQPGSESPLGVHLFYSGKPFRFTSDWFRYVLYRDPDFDVTKLNLTDFAHGKAVNPFNMQTWEGDLSSFKSRKGKLISWHGQADPLISPANSERYYSHVSHTMSLPPSDLDGFYRLFRVSGMGHCSGGDGAWQFGQSLSGTGGQLDEESLNPERNVVMAMVRWVEEGTPPDSLLGTKYVNDSKALGVQRSRKHCKYPLRNRYDGVGDSAGPDSWSCKEV